MNITTSGQRRYVQRVESFREVTAGHEYPGYHPTGDRQSLQSLSGYRTGFSRPQVRTRHRSGLSPLTRPDSRPRLALFPGLDPLPGDATTVANGPDRPVARARLGTLATDPVSSDPLECDPLSDRSLLPPSSTN